jgi:hypothetical protein
LIRTDQDWESRGSVAIDAVDVTIAQAVVDRGLVSSGRLARDLKVSKRTIERRYAALANADVIRLWPTGGAAPAGMSILYLHLDLDSDVSRTRRVREALLQHPNQFLLDLRPRKAWGYLYSASSTSLLRTASEFSRMPGVRSSFAQLYHGMTTSPYFEEVNRRLLVRLATGSKTDRD